MISDSKFQAVLKETTLLAYELQTQALLGALDTGEKESQRWQKLNPELLDDPEFKIFLEKRIAALSQAQELIEQAIALLEDTKPDYECVLKAKAPLG